MGPSMKLKRKTLGGILLKGLMGTIVLQASLSETISGSCYDSVWMLHIVESKTRLKTRLPCEDTFFPGGEKNEKMCENHLVWCQVSEKMLSVLMLCWKKVFFQPSSTLLEVCVFHHLSPWPTRPASCSLLCGAKHPNVSACTCQIRKGRTGWRSVPHCVLSAPSTSRLGQSQFLF